jgi:hypothetical protein
MGKMKEVFMAQRAIDNKYTKYPMRPEECIEPVDCPICDGAGAFGESTCCGDSIVNGICQLCNGNTEPLKCDVCDGSGKVPKYD